MSYVGIFLSLAEESEEEKEKKKLKAKAREEFFAAIKMEGRLRIFHLVFSSILETLPSPSFGKTRLFRNLKKLHVFHLLHSTALSISLELNKHNYIMVLL